MASKTTKDLPSGRRPKPETNGSASSAAKKASKEVAPKEPKVPPRLPAASTASQAASASARPGSARGAPGSARRPGTPTGKTAKKKLQPAPALPKGTTPRADKQPTGGGVAVPQPSERQAKVERSKVEYYSAELLARKPLEDKAREQLGARAGKKVPIEISYTRNEAHRPAGRPEDSVRSRHELVPPTTVVLMFNAHHASFELVAGDVSTLPEAETIELKSLTSGKSIGRIKIAPEKSTPLEERVEFPNEWFVGSEHGLTHDGLQADGYIELRIDWKTELNRMGQIADQAHVAILRVNPWLAYGCGEGARIAIRKPGALEGTASTVQRVLRDDSVVVRRDGAVGEVTVDPTPFTVVLGTNPRHKAGTRLLFVHENACVDAEVMPWPESEIDIKEGSRHNLSVQGRMLSGWLTMVTKEGVSNLTKLEDGGEDDNQYTLATSKALALRAGCDPMLSEKTGAINPKTRVAVLEERETEDFGKRAYVSTIAGQAVAVVAALNEFNHSVQRFPSVAEYEKTRANYCEDIVTREALVEDAITGNMLRIKDQTLYISTATEAQDNVRNIPAEWNVTSVVDLVNLLLQPSPSRSMGLHPAQPVLVRAGPGTGKTWMAKQAVFMLSDKLQRGGGTYNDGIRLVPIVVFVQRIIYLVREASTTTSQQQSLLGRYIESMYAGKKYETWCDMLMQAYEMRALVVLLDGVDEAAGLRDQIEGFVHKELVPSGNRVLVTSRPEGIRLSTYVKTFIVMNLCQLTNEQQRRVINIQMEGNIFFDHLLSLGEVRKSLDDAYRRIGAMTRGDLEALWSANNFRLTAEEWKAEERQHDVSGTRIVAEVTKLKSTYLKALDKEMKDKTAGAKQIESLLDRIDAVMRRLPPTAIEQEFADAVLEGFVDEDEHELRHTVAVALGVLLQRRKNVERLLAEEKKANKGKASGDKDGAGAKKQVATTAAAATASTTEAKEGEKAAMESVAAKLWGQIVLRVDEIYQVAEHMSAVFQDVVKKLVYDTAKDADDATIKQMLGEIDFEDFKDPVAIYSAACEQYAGRFQDNELPEACVHDVVRARLVLPTGAQIVQLVNRLRGGVGFPADGLELKPAEELPPGAEPPPIVTELTLMNLINRFSELDPTHFRHAGCMLRLRHKHATIYCQIEIHNADILKIGDAPENNAYEHYHFFRNRLEGRVEPARLDELLEEKLVFLVDATGIPVLLSLLVLIFTSGGEDLTKLPSNRIELYDLGIESAIQKRLLPGTRTSTDALVHDWLRLFNLDRSAMVAMTQGLEEKKEREHRPTRKASLSQEHKYDVSDVSAAKEAEDAEKKAEKSKVQNNENKQDKKLFNLDVKEVYEVFKHGAHYLREAAKPEVQRTELNRIELSMPKKLVDTTMMLVNANLKMLLGGRAPVFGLTMLRNVAVSNQLEGRREFSAAHVAKALLIDQVNTEGMTLWLHLNKEEGGLPLTKTLEVQTELAPAQYQFKHLSFQEGLFAQHLLIQAAEGWEGWASDVSAAAFLNNPFMNNTCRIASGHLGTLLAKRRPVWDFSSDEALLSEVGLSALWLINEGNETLGTLNLAGNSVGRRQEDSVGLARMLSTSTALKGLDLGRNLLGDLKQYLRPFGRGLGSNKTLTHLNVASNNLLPDGTRIVCNALRTCTAMKWLDLSYNSPGREAALASLLQMHPMMRGIGIVEKEPTTRSERTWWLDTRAKEAVGRALLHSKYSIMFLQCDMFALHEDTTELGWRSNAACDAIMLAGVLRGNTVLKTLNLTSTGSLGDFEREELGRALLANKQGKVGYCDIYGLKEGGAATHSIDLKDKEQIRSLRSFALFAGLLRANSTITSLTIMSVNPEHVDILAEALATNTTLQVLTLEAPNKGGDNFSAALPVQELNGNRQSERIDLWDVCPGSGAMHRQACAVACALMNGNKTAQFVRINPGGSSEGGGILDHVHRARASTLRTLDISGVGLGDRGGSRFFQTLMEGKGGFLSSLHLGDNQLRDAAVGPLIVEALRSDICNIISLDLQNNLIGGPVITQAIKFNKSLTSLDIRGNPIDDDGLWLIGGLLLEEDCPCHLRSIATYAFEIKGDQTSMSLQDQSLEAGAVRSLFGVLKFNDSITELDLSGTGIATSAATDLALALQANQKLKVLDLSRNPLSNVTEYANPNPNVKEDKALKSDTKGIVALANAVRSSATLETITLEGGKLPVIQLKGLNAKVKALDLSRRSLTFLSAHVIGVLLAGNSSITELTLHSNELTPIGAKMIVERLSSSIKNLDLANSMRVEERSKDGKKGDKKDQRSSVVLSSSTAATVDFPVAQLEDLWSAVVKLGSLEKLLMDRDQLEELSSLGSLTLLKTLSLSNNKLTTLPEDLHLVRGLKVFSVHGNRLTELPSCIGQLHSLEKLDIRNNQLKCLPTSISQLKSLKILDAAENLIVSLEPSICDLMAVERFELKENPLQKPPAAIARQGIASIRRYFQELAASGETTSNGCRLVLLGHGEAGKTSLQRGLRARQPKPAAIDERTIQLDIYSLVLGEAANQVVMSMWDLAGQAQYAAALQPYIVDGSLYLLTVPALPVATLTALYSDYVGRWLEYLQAGAPNAIVLPIITKCDLLLEASDKARTCADFATKAAAQVEWLKKAFERHQNAQPEDRRRLRIQDDIVCISAVAGGTDSLEELRQRLETLVFAEPPVLPSVSQTIPRTWLLAMTFLRALRDGRDTIDAGWAAERGTLPSVPSDAKYVPRSYVSYTAVKEQFMTEFAPALKMQVADDSTLQDARNMLCNQGEIFSSSGIVYLQPDYVTRLLKPLVDHRLGRKFLLAHQESFPSDYTDIERTTAINAAEALVMSGELREELLAVLWEPVGLNRDDFGNVALMLCSAGVLFLAEHTHQGRRWVMPMRLPDVQPSDVKSQWALQVSDEETEVLGIIMRLGYFAPPGILERLMAGAYGLGKYHRFWKRGAMIETDKLGLLIELRDKAIYTEEELTSEEMKAANVPTREFELSLEFCGDKGARTAMWVALSQVRQMAETVLDDFPGLEIVSEFQCPGCVSKAASEGVAATPTRWPLDDAAMKPLRCERCGENIALQAIPLNPEKIAAMTLILTSDTGVPELKFSSDKVRFGKPLEASLGLQKLLGLKDASDIERLRAAGETAIVDEFAAYAPQASLLGERDEYGWSDIDWFYYVTGTKPAEIPAVAAGDAAETVDSAEELARPSRGGALTAPPGIDEGRDDVRLSTFLSQPLCVSAGLHKVHVLALRLYSSPAYRTINRFLHDGCSPERPHPYPATVICLIDALNRLRRAQGEARAAELITAQAARDVVVEDEEDEEALAAVAAAKLECERLTEDLTFWRGSPGFSATEFKARGGTEISFLSTSVDRNVAQKAALEQMAAADKAMSTARSGPRSGRMRPDSARSDVSAASRRVALAASPPHGSATAGAEAPEVPLLLMRLRVPAADTESLPTDISFLSVAAADHEWVYPPGVYLEQKKEWTEVIVGAGAEGDQTKLVEVTPHRSISRSAIAAPQAVKK